MTFFPLPRLARGASIALIALGQFACAADPPAPAPAPAPAVAPAAGLSDITALIGQAECDAQEQCHVVGVGAKPCGGPNGYLAWSSRKTDGSALQAAVASNRQAETEANRKSGLMSNCMVMPEPSAVCRPRASDGRRTCQLGQGGVRGAD